jgi:polyisoprenoid-binding protein YceI
MRPVTTWQLDPVHTEVGFAVKHLMISTVKGRFAEVQGTVRMNEQDPATAVVEAAIAVASITTGNPERDAHLRSADFFDAERFPTLAFRSRRVEKAADGELRLVGDLTIRDVTREIVLSVSPEGVIQDPWGNRRAGFSGSLRIKRSDFGITWNQWIEAGGVAVGDEVHISIEAELVQAQEKAAA